MRNTLAIPAIAPPRQLEFQSPGRYINSHAPNPSQRGKDSAAEARPTRLRYVSDIVIRSDGTRKDL
jgi:hypothetical protein